MSNRLYTRYVRHSQGSRTEYISLSLHEGTHEEEPDHFFSLSGVGIPVRAECEDLSELESLAEEVSQVSDGRRSADEISEGEKMTSKHHDSLMNSIFSWQDEFGEKAEASTVVEGLDF